MTTAKQPEGPGREQPADEPSGQPIASQPMASQQAGGVAETVERLEAQVKERLEAGGALEAELLPDATQLAVAAGGALLAGVLYLLMPERLLLGPNWLPLVLESLLLAPSLVCVFFLDRHLPYRIARGLALALLGVLTLMLCASVARLVMVLMAPGTNPLAGPELLRAGALLWIVNILVFAVWYWEVDGEGPLSRLQALYLPADLLFPQQQGGNPTHWVPGFLDYVFVAFCFSTALSPADTAPLSRRLKALMMAQAAISLTIIVLLVGRSVNILPTQ
ncbi:MAG TPA: hypothetical protein VF120_11010 [Ktedonobacterales bacterium]